MPSSSRRTRKASRSAGSCSGKRQVRGLWANSCTESIPNACAFSGAFLIPPEQWPPRSMPPKLPEPCRQAGRLVLELAPRGARKWFERLERDPAAVEFPEAGDHPVDEERLLHVPVLVNHRLAIHVRQDARAVLVREQQLVPARQQSRRRRRVGRSERGARKIEQLAAVLVAEAPQAKQFEAGREVADRHAAPLGKVGPRGRPEGAEVAPDRKRGCLAARRMLVVGGLERRRAAEAVVGALGRLLQPPERHHP